MKLKIAKRILEAYNNQQDRLRERTFNDKVPLFLEVYISGLKYTLIEPRLIEEDGILVGMDMLGVDIGDQPVFSLVDVDAIIGMGFIPIEYEPTAGESVFPESILQDIFDEGEPEPDNI